MSTNAQTSIDTTGVLVQRIFNIVEFFLRVE